MHLTLNGELHPLADIRDFRKAQQLPPEFGVSLFEPKDYSGLASLEHAGEALQGVRQATLEVIPPEIRYMMLLPFMEQLTQYFRVRLQLANGEINLKEEEIDFAVNGFEALAQQIAYVIIYARNTRTPAPDFEDIYAAWVDASVRVSARVHEYTHRGMTWQIQIINTIYGRAGLMIDTGAGQRHYLRDAALACPAQGFMYQLMKSIAEQVHAALI